jgi:hypothetical protein
MKSLENEKMVLYVRKNSKKSSKSRKSRRENPETIKNRAHSGRNKGSIGEDSMNNRKTKDTSTERKTRILSAQELVKKKNKLTLEMTKPVQIIVMGGDTTFMTSTSHNVTENTIDAEHLISLKNYKSKSKHDMYESTQSGIMDQSFMMENSEFRTNKAKENSMMKLNESSILSVNPHFKNMNLSSDILADDSLLKKILPDHFLAGMKEGDILNFNTLTEKEKKIHLMMMRRKSSKSLALSKHTKSP